MHCIISGVLEIDYVVSNDWDDDDDVGDDDDHDDVDVDVDDGGEKEVDIGESVHNERVWAIAPHLNGCSQIHVFYTASQIMNAYR